MKYHVGMCSGGFDPIHVGHVRYIVESMNMCDQIIVIVNSDEWLKKKKGFAFMPLEERIEILRALVRENDIVCVQNDSSSHDVSSDIKALHPSVFLKGGDRSVRNIPAVEKKTARSIGCIILTNVGGGKIQSSSQLVKQTVKHA